MAINPDEPTWHHSCEGDLPTEGPDGASVTSCEGYSDGTLWVFGPGGVTSQVGYCPYCGYEARTVPTIVMLKRIGCA